MHNRPRKLTLRTTLFGASFLMLLGTAHAGVFPGRPDVLVCSVHDPTNVQPWEKFAFYVSAKLKDGSILYKSLTSNPVLVTVSTDGRVVAKNLEDCDGKAVAEIRAEGRAFDFSK